MGREGVVIGGQDYVLSQADALTKNGLSVPLNEQSHGLLAVFMGLGVQMTHVTKDQTFLWDPIFFQYKKFVGPKKFSDPKFFIPKMFLRTKIFLDPNFF